MEPITSRQLLDGRQNIPMVAAARTLTQVSRQLWAMLNPLLASDSHQAGMFANVERHNELEAWRRIAEPINEDKAHVRRDLLATVTNPNGGGCGRDIDIRVVSQGNNGNTGVDNSDV